MDTLVRNRRTKRAECPGAGIADGKGFGLRPVCAHPVRFGAHPSRVAVEIGTINSYNLISGGCVTKCHNMSQYVTFIFYFFRAGTVSPGASAFRSPDAAAFLECARPRVLRA